MNYDHFMRIAIEEAKKSTSEDPEYIHPFVGSVIVQRNSIVAKAYRNENGKGSHAEYLVLRKAEGSHFDTIVTTLEPCTYRSTNPETQARPCAERIGESRVKTVIVGMLDPNPRIKGNGISYLREMGIYVVEGILEEEIMELNAQFIDKFLQRA